MLTHRLRPVLALRCAVWALFFLAAGGMRAQQAPVVNRILIADSPADRGQLVVFYPFFSNVLSSDVTFQWRKDGADIAGATAEEFRIPAVTTADAGTYTLVATNAAGSGSASAVLTIKNLAPPVFLTPPRGATLYVGQSMSFFFRATGSYPRTYQWRKDGVPLTGATREDLTLSSITLADAGAYSVVVTNSQGSATSASAALTVNAAIPLVFQSNTPADTSVIAGQALTLNAFLQNGTDPIVWQWFKDGVAIPGATSGSFVRDPVALADAGRYAVTGTNAAGSSTSRTAVVTILPATPVTFTSVSAPTTIYEGQPFSLQASATGSQPIVMQWYKDGVALAGATTSFYGVSSGATLFQAGSYTMTATNGAGTVSTAPILVTVLPAVRPTIVRQPLSQTVDYRSPVTLSVEAAGSPILKYQWKKDGIALPGDLSAATSTILVFTLPTPAINGSYTVEVSNAGGSVTSNAAVVTVRPVAAPVIKTHPVSISSATGTSVSFFVVLENPLAADVSSFKWYRNNVLVQDGPGSAFSIGSVTAADEADYVVVITGPGGTVTSQAAHLTVLVPEPAGLEYRQLSLIGRGAVGFSGGLSAGLSGVKGPFSYQWFKDGLAIPGATGGGIAFPKFSPDDIGVYTATLSNDGGVVSTSPFYLNVFEDRSSQLPWLDAAQFGDIVYFLARSPSRIERYDLVEEKWLASTRLAGSETPTAFLPVAEGVYVTYPGSLVRLPLDLRSEATVATATVGQFGQLFVLGDWLYFGGRNDSTFSRVSRSTLIAGAPAKTIPSGNFVEFPVSAAVVAPGLRRVFSPSVVAGLGSFPIQTDGTFGTSGVSGFFASIGTPDRLYLFPGERYLADNFGAIYRTSDLSYASALGESFNDLAFFSDGTPVALRGFRLTTYSADGLRAAGRARISFTGARVFARGTDAFVFGAPPDSTAPYLVTKVAQSALTPEVPLPATVPVGRFSIDDVFLGENNVVHIFSRSAQGLVRWSLATRTFLPTLPLRPGPASAVNQPGSTRALFSYLDGRLSQVKMTASPVEEQLSAVCNTPNTLADLGGLTLVHTNRGAASETKAFVLGADGTTPAGSKALNVISPSVTITWNAARRRLYQYIPGNTLGSLSFTDFTEAGVPLSNNQSPRLIQGTTLPLRLNAEGTLLVTGDGRVLNADLTAAGALANNIVDAAWLSSALFTVRTVSGRTELQRWSRTNYLQTGTLSIPGTAPRILALGTGQALVVSSVFGTATFTVVNADLTVDAPLPTTVEGVYFGRLTSFGGMTGDLALYVRSDRSAVVLAQTNVGPDASTRATLFASGFTLNSNGTFSVSARDLASRFNATALIQGTIFPDGSFNGSVSEPAGTFSGTRASGAFASAGYYQATALNGRSGAAHLIVGPDGRALLVAQASPAADGGAVTLDGSGKLSFVSSAGAKLTATVGAGGALSATLEATGSAAAAFGGLREGVARTDRLANISTRGRAGAGDDVLIAGFVLSGSASRPVLIRAIGPALGAFGVPGTLADPRLALYRGDAKLSENDNWSSDSAAGEIAATTTRVGGFALASGSTDAALLVTLTPGAYTAQVGAPVGSTPGNALVEVYDTGPAPTGGAAEPRLINIATRGRIAAAGDTLIAGIVVTGNSPKRILIRAIGAGLAAFGVPGTLADPVLTLTGPTASGTGTLATNDDWGTPASGAATAIEIAATAIATGAFALPTGSKDACLLLTLAPGNYTAQVTGKSNGTGVALIEVYEANN
jgi:hypothetical protein